MAEPILQVKDLYADYTEDSKGTLIKKSKTEVLRAVSFSIREGEILGLVGESGSGKSTLAKVITGMLKDYRGTVNLNTSRPQMVFQDPFSSLNPSKKVGWILKEPLRIKGGYSKAETEKMTFEMLEKVGLEKEIAGRYPRQLSGGQRQRVCIAAALMLRPRLLVADEPVSALDVTIQAQVTDLLLSLQKEFGLAILFISHDLRIVYKMCDRVIILKDGEIVEEGTVEDIYFMPKHDYTKALLNANIL